MQHCGIVLRMGTTTITQKPAAGGTSCRVTKRFNDGLLQGMTHTSVTSVKFEVGQVVKPWAYGSGYVVEACEVVSMEVA